MTEQFKTSLKEQDIELFGEETLRKEFSEEIVPVSAVIDWDVDIEMRDWGIKSINKSLIRLKLVVARKDFNGNVLEELKFADMDFNDVSFECSQMEGNTCYIGGIEVDFIKKEVRIL